MLELVIDELKKVATDFYNVTNINIVLFDAERHILFSYPKKMNKFCSEIRTNPHLEKKCFECDNIGFDNCEKTGKPHIYRCHMNLAEAIAPIIENGVTIGYIMLGQMLMDNDISAAKEKINSISQKYNFDPQKLLNYIKKSNVISSEKLTSLINIASMCSCYLYVNKIIKKRSDFLSYQIRDYIDTHISDSLSVKKLCRQFYISKSKLYAISQKNFGMGISDYIRNIRLEKSKLLLKDSLKSISDIADEVGFKDANYFIRVFKSKEGITPNKYRQKVL